MNKIYLYEDFFTKEEREVFALGNLSASLFTYSTGVKAVRLKNDRGAIVVLPYMGQMIWRAEFDGYDMTMKTIFDEHTRAKEVFGETYGCFLMHCGLTAMGNPTAEDDHTPHGELPICKYQTAFIVSKTSGKVRLSAPTKKYCACSTQMFSKEFRLRTRLP